MKRTVIIFTIIFLLALPAAADGGTQLKIRIEGADANLYSSVMTFEGDTVSVADALAAAGYGDVSALSSPDGFFAGERNGAFGGDDRWQFAINGVITATAPGETQLGSGDSLVVFYAGFPSYIPTVRFSQDTGMLTISTKAAGPVSGATVIWGYSNGSIAYATDESGTVTIDKAYLETGVHPVSVEKNNAEGLPLIVRTAPDFSLTVKDYTASTRTVSYIIIAGAVVLGGCILISKRNDKSSSVKQ